MSIFERLFGSSTHQEITDPVFGPLVCQKAVWIGRAHAAGQAFNVFVIAGHDGPSTQQRTFFEGIIEGLPALFDIAQRFVREQTHNSTFSELRIYAIEVGPDAEIAEHRFTIELSPPGESEVHRVEFKGREAVSYGCDD